MTMAHVSPPQDMHVTSLGQVCHLPGTSVTSPGHICPLNGDQDTRVTRAHVSPPQDTCVHVMVAVAHVSPPQDTRVISWGTCDIPGTHVSMYW